MESQAAVEKLSERTKGRNAGHLTLQRTQLSAAAG